METFFATIFTFFNFVHLQEVTRGQSWTEKCKIWIRPVSVNTGIFMANAWLQELIVEKIELRQTMFA